MLSKMRNALRCIRIEKISTTMVSRSFGIPTRTLRRYVNFSKDPEDKLFFMQVAEEKEENDEEHSQVENQEVDSEDEEFVPVSWKPQTTVPMFALYTDDAKSMNDAKSTTTSETAYPMVSECLILVLRLALLLRSASVTLTVRSVTALHRLRPQASWT